NLRPDSETTPVGSTEDTSINLIDLNPGTTYYVWVKAHCDDGGNWSPAILLTTPFTTPVPWTEKFNTTVAPMGWSIAGWELGTHSAFPDATGNVIYKNLYTTYPTGAVTTLAVGEIFPENQLMFYYQLVNYTDQATAP